MGRGRFGELIGYWICLSLNPAKRTRTKAKVKKWTSQQITLIFQLTPLGLSNAINGINADFCVALFSLESSKTHLIVEVNDIRIISYQVHGPSRVHASSKEIKLPTNID